MRLQLHKLNIQLESKNELILSQWRALFEGWLEEKPSPAPVNIHFTLEFANSLPDFPNATLIFQDQDSGSGHDGILDVYQLENGQTMLHFLDGACIQMSLDKSQTGATAHIHGIINQHIMETDRFEDVVFTSLAPLLRQHGYYIVHAFAASKNGQAALIVGTTHSGKTTTGLSLLLDGWQLLSNDAVLLEERNGTVFALPTPGDVGIRPFTFQLLPRLLETIGLKTAPEQAYSLSGERLINGRWGAPCPISTVLIPKIESQPTSSLKPLSRAVALTLLMQESMDRWDAQTLLDHIDILQKTCQQAITYTLHLGQDVTSVDKLLSE